MRIRAIAAAGWVLATLLAPRPTSAQTVLQDRQPGASPDGRLTAFLAYAPRFTRAERRQVYVDGELREGAFAIRNSSARGAGFALEIRAFDVIRLGGSFALLRRDASVELDSDGNTLALQAADVLLSRASIVVRFQEGADALQRSRLRTALYAGPAYLLEIPRGATSGEAELRAMGSWSFAAGMDAEVNLTPGVALQFGIEDYMIHWDDEELGRRVDESFAERGLDTTTRVSAAGSHGWLLRVGMAFIFR